MPVVHAANLSRHYGDTHALKGVSFDIEEGGIVGLLGPNGAGKSTTLRILTGELAPTGGNGTVCGHDVLTEPRAVAAHLGYLPEGAPLYEEMTVGAALRFVARVRGMGSAETARAIDQTTEKVGVRDRLGQTVGTLSRGFRQRVGLAQAMLHQPRLLVLDEPTTGLDPNQIVEIRSLIRELADSCTVLLSSHVLPEVQNTCDRVLILNDGELVADAPVDTVLGGTAHQIRIGLGPSKIHLEDAQLREQLAGLGGVVRVTSIGERAFLLDAEDDVREAVFHWAVAEGQVLVELSARTTSLEEAFRRLTSV